MELIIFRQIIFFMLPEKVGMSLNPSRVAISFPCIVGSRPNLILVSTFENSFIPFLHFVSFHFGFYSFLFDSRGNGKKKELLHVKSVSLLWSITKLDYFF